MEAAMPTCALVPISELYSLLTYLRHLTAGAERHHRRVSEQFEGVDRRNQLAAVSDEAGILGPKTEGDRTVAGI
ncbi:MAG: hypothetical protein GY798_31725 [Hyphomicrobiales bacterium]|nr:hypothetical protein [Hyphomicrobiales bacterium]